MNNAAVHQDNTKDIINLPLFQNSGSLILFILFFTVISSKSSAFFFNRHTREVNTVGETVYEFES
jgi:hypothetical protein